LVDPLAFLCLTQLFLLLGGQVAQRLPVALRESRAPRSVFTSEFGLQSGVVPDDIARPDPQRSKPSVPGWPHQTAVKYRAFPGGRLKSCDYVVAIFAGPRIENR